MTTRSLLGGVALAGALGAGCGGEAPGPTPTTTSTRPPASTSTTVPAAAVSPSTVAGPATTDDGRRILEERGIDPDQLSKDIAEQLRGRFQAKPGQ